MTQSILAGLTFAVAVALVSGTGCQSSGVGDPCTPEAEYDPSFLGFDVHEVNVESKSFQCQTRLCLVNHFQGRVSCPYGQDKMGAGYPTASGALAAGCQTPANQVVNGLDSNGNPLDMTALEMVPAQCIDRSADKAVYCSCRCENAQGQTNDGSNYCSCPAGFHCGQLVAPIGASNEGLTGGYCIKDSTDYDPNDVCKSNCNPVLKDCGPVALAK
jgi:hypothetical protein